MYKNSTLKHAIYINKEHNSAYFKEQCHNVRLLGRLSGEIYVCGKDGGQRSHWPPAADAYACLVLVRPWGHAGTICPRSVLSARAWATPGVLFCSGL